MKQIAERLHRFYRGEYIKETYRFERGLLIITNKGVYKMAIKMQTKQPKLYRGAIGPKVIT